MSTPTKQAPAKAAAKSADKPARTRTTVAPIDYSQLAAADTELPESASALVHSTPFPAWVKESRESGKAKLVTVPATHQGQTEGLIRKAAALNGHGVKIISKVNENGTVSITFQAKDKRAANKPKD